MAKKEKSPFTFQSNLDKVVPKIHEAPERVMNVIGSNLVREIRGTLRQYYRKKSGNLDKSLGYSLSRPMYKESVGEWPPTNTPTMLIGFKMFYAPFVLRHNDPIKPIIVKNQELIQKMIAEAIDEINKA